MKNPLTLEEINNRIPAKVKMKAIDFSWKINKFGLKKKYVVCLCECGNEVEGQVSTFVKGGKQSCGCFYAYSNPRKYTHNIPRLYKIWKGIRRRCYKKKDRTYQRYGAKGVRMCEEWKNNYQLFLSWALENGWKPGLQIDKDIKAPTKPGKLYCPEYCSIVTPKQNANSKSDSNFQLYKGEIKTVAEICDIEGAVRHIVYGRLSQGHSLEDALNPVQKRRSPFKYLYMGKKMTVGEIAKQENIPVGRIISLMRYHNKDIHDVVKKIINGE